MTMERDSLVARLEETKAILLRIHQTILSSNMRSVYPPHPDTWSSWSSAILDAAVALETLSRPEQVVKALEWADGRGSYASFKFGPETAYYSVDLADDGLDIWVVGTGIIGSEFGGTEIHKCVGRDEAKSAAEKYHQRRVAALTKAAPLQADASAPASPAIGVQAVTRPARVQAAFEVWRDKPETGPNASALFEYIERLEAALHPAPEAASAGAECCSAISPCSWQRHNGMDDVCPPCIAATGSPVSPPPPDTAPSPKGVSDGVRDVLAERRRQIEAEGWTPEHDDHHDRGEMLTAAWCYMQRHADKDMFGDHYDINALPAPARWPWDRMWWKPTNRRRDLVKAGALIFAEIERLDRLSPATAEERAASKEGA